MQKKLKQEATLLPQPYRRKNDAVLISQDPKSGSWSTLLLEIIHILTSAYFSYKSFSFHIDHVIKFEIGFKRTSISIVCGGYWKTASRCFALHQRTGSHFSFYSGHVAAGFLLVEQLEIKQTLIHRYSLYDLLLEDRSVQSWITSVKPHKQPKQIKRLSSHSVINLSTA